MTALATLLRDGLEQATPAERKVGRVLLAQFPASALQTAAAVAAQAGVSAPTVMRLVTRLGFASYPAFQRQVREELAAGSPAALYGTSDVPAAVAGEPRLLTERTAEVQREALAATFAALPASDLETAIAWLADDRRRVVLHGGRFSGCVAEYFALHLTQLRDDVDVLPSDPVRRAATLAGLTRRDVLVLFDYRRYEPASARFAEVARAHDAGVVLFTDPWLSPVTAHADVVLPTRVDSVSPYDSLVPLCGLVEAVVTGVLGRLGDAGRRRLQRLEDETQRWNLYGEE
ncbi:MurR/RpiR family transcriptional regulator [Lapillicoccus jejuensis]|uniref:RpiR family transcriptional regulator n=1 Tax=Lapillicoccus jejuensis TaxID=402171 RepID=A0A542E2D3_9MICO|nr:MurR/RpiR family transcriptional regulator [Lapillicoccus jejuensis]TQJ09497.1 RpiR family transcriptional regulator [Lapillicoccus jejuensis]